MVWVQSLCWLDIFEVPVISDDNDSVTDQKKTNEKKKFVSFFQGCFDYQQLLVPLIVVPLCRCGLCGEKCTWIEFSWVTLLFRKDISNSTF